jgi:hypothetical protein
MCCADFYLNIKILKLTVISPVVLYEYEAWSLTLREEHGFSAFNDTRRGECKWTSVAGRDRRVEKLHKCEAPYLTFFTKYYQDEQIKDNKLSGTFSAHLGDEKRLQNFDQEIEGSLEISECKWVILQTLP